MSARFPLLVLLLVLLNGSASFRNSTKRHFPSNFLFGVATSSYQIEGAWNVDGKGESIWDRFTHITPSLILNDDKADIACDSYYRFKEDIQNAKKLGVRMYRFSISWTRVLPTGYADNINQKGLDYYKTLVKEIIDNKMIPVCTIYHWDLPQRLVEDGNDWRSERIIPIFVNYARIVIENLPDVKLWITINEPKQICHWGYGLGYFPPQVQGSGTTEYQCSYVVLKTHAAVYRMYKKEFPRYKAKMTIVIDCPWMEPYSKSIEDTDAAERQLQFECGIYYYPLCKGDWPEVVKERIRGRSESAGLNESRLPAITESDSSMLKNSLDLVTLNYYTTYLVRADEEGPKNETSYDNDLAIIHSFSPNWTVETVDHFAIVPFGVYKILKWIDSVCPKKEILITEIGMAEDGTSLDDQDRIQFYKEHLCKILEAIQEGVKVVGVIFWTLFDNFEWRSGYGAHMGLYHTNASTDSTLARTPKKSVGFVQNLTKNRRLKCEKSKNGLLGPLRKIFSKFPTGYPHGSIFHRHL